MQAFNHYFIDTIRNRYAKFNGRATRSEYWYFVLFYIILSIIMTTLDAVVLNPMLGMTANEANQGGFLQTITALALLIPSIALAVRRLHDIGKSGWWLLVGLIPIAGFFVLIYYYVTDSQAQENLYGPNPK